MVLKCLFALVLVAAANAGQFTQISYGAPALAYSAPVAYAASPLTYAGSAVGSTQQNVVRSFGGTVSQYSKAVDTPFSSVRKVDTRINNNVYTPALAKTITYAAPASNVYAHSAAVYSPADTVAHVTFDGFGAHYVY